MSKSGISIVKEVVIADAPAEEIVIAAAPSRSVGLSSAPEVIERRTIIVPRRRRRGELSSFYSP